MPIGATKVSPQWLRPGSSRWPGLRRKKVTVSAAWGAMPSTAPLPPSTPLGTSTATTGRWAASSLAMTSRATPSIGRASPAPNSASITSPASAMTAGANGSTGPVQRAAAAAASPFSASRDPSSATRTGQPRSARRRAVTNPSPPLLPGPHSTSAGCFGQRRATASATARPAFSISAMPATPPAIVSRSASSICCGVSSACRFQPGDSSLIAGKRWGGPPGPQSPQRRYYLSLASARHEPAVDVVGLAGNVAAARGGQEDRHCRDVVRRVGAADRDPGLLFGQQLFHANAALGGAGHGVARAELGAGNAGADRVDIDVVAAELLRRHLGQRDHRPLAGGVGRVGGAGIAAAADRGDVDDPSAAPVGIELPDHLARGALETEEHALRIDPVDAAPIR